MPTPTQMPALPAAQGSDSSATLEGLIESIPVLESVADPMDFLNEPLLTPLQISIISVISLIIIGGILWWVRRRPKQAAIPESPAQIARRKLNALQQRAQNLHEASVETSLYLREFITGKSHDPALFETQQEFNLRDSSLENIPSEFREPTRLLLDKLARLKYSPNTSTDVAATQSMIAEAEKLISKIDLAIQVHKIQEMKERGGEHG